MSVLRFDRGTLGDLEETPQGGLAIPAYLTRVGVFEYEQPNGKTLKEYRPPEEVFHKDALATLPNATLTNEHPSGHVNPDNFRRHVVGHVEKDVKQDGDKVSARLIVQDAKTLREIRANNKREVSCGYHCDVDEVPGVSPDGTRYDRVQRNIRYNHVALVDNGRAGPDVRLRLDSKGNQGDTTMKVEVIDNVEYEVGTAPHADAVQRRTDAAKHRKDAADKLIADAARIRADAAKDKARADAAEANLKKAQATIVKLRDPLRLDEAVKVRGAVVGKAMAVLGKNFKVDGLSNLDIKTAAVKKEYPNLKLDGKYADPKELRIYIDGLFRGIKTIARADARQVPDHLRRPPPGVRTDGGEQGGRTIAEIRQDRDEDARHRRPLAVSKSSPTKEMTNVPTLQGSQLETMR